MTDVIEIEIGTAIEIGIATATMIAIGTVATAATRMGTPTTHRALTTIGTAGATTTRT